MQTAWAALAQSIPTENLIASPPGTARHCTGRGSAGRSLIGALACRGPRRVFPTPPDVKVETIAAPACPAEWLTPPGVRTDAVVLYLHGGGYVIGSPRSHRHLAAAIARAAGTRALLLDYRLAPEHPFPAAL